MRTGSVIEERTTMRRDTVGRWHAVASMPCEECGCLYDYSLDEPGLVWEAGPNVEPGCGNDVCECHVMPVSGLAFKLHLVSHR